MKKHQRIKNLALFLCAAAALLTVVAMPAFAAEEKPKPKTLFTNVHVFDGVNEKRIENANVLVEGSMITQISTGQILAEGATVIEGNPLKDLSAVTDQDNLKIIMKDGKIYKNTL